MNEEIAPSGKSSEIISPASGTIIGIADEGDKTVITVFLSLFDNHTQYSPYDGKVIDVVEARGSNMPAFLQKAKKNCKVETILRTKKGEMRVRQMTGFFFRRIENVLEPGEAVSRGDRIGSIMFGSRVELSFPTVFSIVIGKGEKVEGGKTVIAKLG